MEVSFPSADKSFDLYGDLYLPEESARNNNKEEDDKSAMTKIPAIVVVAGSGPIDRNGNAPGLLTGLKLNTSNRFAECMMEISAKNSPSSSDDSAENASTIITKNASIAVLTYDKRGVGKSLKADDKRDWYYRAGMMDLVSDAVEAVRFLQSHESIDPNSILILGHSEGSIILPLICQAIRNDADGLSDIKGSIFLSGFGENLFDAIQFQQENTIQEVETMEGVKGWVMRKLITRARVEKQHQDLMEKIDSQVDMDYTSMYCGIAKIPAKWFRDHKAFQAQAVLASEMTCHCLAITGGKDVQVRHDFCEPATAKTLVPKAASIESYILENMTHVLRCVEGTPSMLSLKQDYAHQGTLPLDSELLDLIVDWCDRRILHNK